MKIYRHDSKEGIDILNSLPVHIVTEKIDGSFLVFEKENGKLKVHSKTQDITNEHDKMFSLAVDYLHSIADKIPGHMRFYCEYVRSLRHNRITYENLPSNNLICWLLHNKETGTWGIPYDNKYCQEIMIDVVTNINLGGSISEGEVIHCFSEDEKQHGAVKKVNPEFAEAKVPKRIIHQDDVVKTIMSSQVLENRWHKALFRLKEQGVLTQSSKDIGSLLKEVSIDFEAEEKETIKEELWQWYRKSFIKSAHTGLADWYISSQLENS